MASAKLVGTAQISVRELKSAAVARPPRLLDDGNQP
jgi:hypothetical protein